MVQTSNLPAFKQRMSIRAKNVVKYARDANNSSARYMLLTAKRLAPRHTGETIRGITKKEVKKGFEVVSKVNGPFLQNFFANQIAPYRTLNFKAKGGKFYYASNQKVVYGGTALTWTDKQITWTGTARFWHFALLKTQDIFGKLHRSNLKKALRVNV